MADISKEIRNFQDAILGEDVRGSMISLAEKVNAEVEANTMYVDETAKTANSASQTAEQTSKDVQTVRQEAQDAVNHANVISGQNRQYVDDTVATYKQYADEKLEASEMARTGSEAAATLAESWAVGGTGERQGEDGNNSKFHAEKSKESAERATQEADRAAQYASIVAPGFLVDLGSMELYMKVGVGVDFVVTADAELCWKIA